MFCMIKSCLRFKTKLEALKTSCSFNQSERSRMTVSYQKELCALLRGKHQSMMVIFIRFSKK